MSFFTNFICVRLHLCKMHHLIHWDLLRLSGFKVHRSGWSWITWRALQIKHQRPNGDVWFWNHGKVEVFNWYFLSLGCLFTKLFRFKSSPCRVCLAVSVPVFYPCAHGSFLDHWSCLLSCLLGCLDRVLEQEKESRRKSCIQQVDPFVPKIKTRKRNGTKGYHLNTDTQTQWYKRVPFE